MAGKTKVLTFSEGVTVSAPTQSFLTASGFEVFASDGAYVTAKGSAAEEGDAYYNSTDDAVRVHNGTAFVEQVDVSGSQVLTGKDYDGGTASDTSRTTLASAAKATLDGLTRKEGNLFYATDDNAAYADDGTNLHELVDADSAQVLTAKDVDGGTASNTSRITLPSDTKTNLDSLTRKEGTVVYATDDNAVYADDGTTLREVLDATSSQVVTGKDIDGGTASNTSRVTVPKDTKTNLDSLTRKEGTVVYASDEDKLYADNGTSLVEVGGAASISIATIKDIKSSGTSGGPGSSVSGTWATRTLNTLEDPSAIVTSLTSNQFTLPAGDYLIEASAPAFDVDNHKIKLRNTTDSTDDSIGSTEKSHSTDLTGSRSFISEIISIAGAKAFEIQHRIETDSSSNTRSFGEANSFGVSEVYTIVKITKL